MSILAVTDIGDLITATLADLPKLKLVDLMHGDQTYIAFNRLFNQYRMDVQSGTQIRIDFITAVSPNARFKGLYAIDPDASQDDALEIGNVPWRFGDYFWDFDEHEPMINEGAAQIQDYVRIKRLRAFRGWAEHLEEWFWDTPPGTSDKKNPWNLRYWLQKDVTTVGDEDGVVGSGSFAPAMPGSHTTIAGLDASADGDMVRFNNWKYKYSNVSDDDLLVKMRRTNRFTNFMPPQGMTYPSYSGPISHELLCGSGTFSGLERLVENRNDNLGYDLNVQAPTFARAPITWVRQLNDDDDEPIYHMDWGVWHFAVNRNRFMRPKPPAPAPRQHNVMRQWTDMMMNIVVDNRRRLAVGAKAAAND